MSVKEVVFNHIFIILQSITKVIGQTIEEACASKAMQQEGNKIKLTDLKERGKNRLIDAKKKLIEEEKKRKQRFIVPEKKDDWDDEFDNDLLWQIYGLCSLLFFHNISYINELFYFIIYSFHSIFNHFKKTHNSFTLYNLHQSIQFIHYYIINCIIFNFILFIDTETTPFNYFTVKF